MNKLLKYSIVTAALMIFAGNVSAAPMYCSVSNPNSDGMDTNNVTYNGTDSDDCYGVVQANDSETLINSLDLWDAVTTPWSLLAKDDTNSGNGSFGGVNFNLSTTAGTSGNWTLTGTAIAPVTLPVYLDFMVVLKGSQRFGAWFLDNVAFDGNDGGTWAINFVNNGGNVPNLSHMSLYTRAGDTPPCTVNCGPNQIPEPTSLLLMGAGLISFGFARRRRSAA
ncbi:PEP-CTERM sorting domain-containing protein [Candidatus Nitrotoga sp. M5]|uniref:PEP-CTERM sorting domain-containing protein n=1 Tax=Candidatus Nitrotoga sp. M5 TaxID=2890409 RepID=UPI001EF5635D|nr:PEP-CTERM sorting domain-containing protein [Candidatus Nitrotoga sp. M5]CAH1387874.1 PEP-CTERM protein-sorting domain-containing protein [Candidatus Nitrotoga sp. M5]